MKNRYMTQISPNSHKEMSLKNNYMEYMSFYFLLKINET